MNIDSNHDIKLTENFALHEVWDWAKHIPGMTPADRIKATNLAKGALTIPRIINAVHQVLEMQELRDYLNMKYPGLNIRIRITCWLRHIKWEYYRGRDGSSQHVHGIATDFVVICDNHKMHDVLMAEAFEWLNARPGFTKKYETFIHRDQRGVIPY